MAQAKRWDEFHSLAKDDLPRPDVALFLKMMTDYLGGSAEKIIIACTGRNEKYRQATLEWLIKHDLAVFDTILMRPDGDFRPDVEMKPAMLAEFKHSIRYGSGEEPDVAFILEDRDKVVEAWRELGYACWQVNAGGY